MFEIGFTEILLCCVVALIVFGPDKLPVAARTAGLWIGRIKRMLADTRREIERELGADDVRRQLHNENIMRQLNESKEAVNAAVNETVLPPPAQDPDDPHED